MWRQRLALVARAADGLRGFSYCSTAPPPTVREQSAPCRSAAPSAISLALSVSASPSRMTLASPSASSNARSPRAITSASSP
eukprot:6175137-Prymnesium_polylepis.2